MLILKRSITAIVIFIPLFIIIYLACLIVGGAIVGGMAGMQDPDNAYAAGQAAGEEFGKRFGGLLFLASLLFSALIAGALGFTNLLPWCRAEKKTLETETPS